MQDSPTLEPQLVDVREFLSVLRARRFTVLLVAFIVIGLCLALVYRREPVYTATARVEVRPLTSSLSYPGAFYDLQSSMDTEAERVTSEPVAAIAGRGIGEAAANSANVTTSVPPNTTFVDISCVDPSADTAQRCANSFALGYIEDRSRTAAEEYDTLAEPFQSAIEEANQELETLNQQLAQATSETERNAILGEISSVRTDRDTAQLQLLAVPTPSASPARLSLPADLPTVPSNKGYVTTTFLASILGLAAGIALAFVRERLDERVGDRQTFEKALGAPVFSMVPHVPGWRNRSDTRAVTISAPDSASAEAYRAARTMLSYLAKEGGLKVIAVTGPGQSEGKTTTTVNLGVSLAQSGKRVIAVSADLRKPRMHRFFHLDNSVGVTSVLTGQAEVITALARTEVPNLLVLSSGPIPPNPAELLASSAMDELLAELRTMADIVLVDTPPTLVVSDILGIVPKVDGVIAIADASTTHRSAITQLRHQLERVGGQILGGILNNVDASATKRSYGGYGGYGYRDDYREKPAADGDKVKNGNGHAIDRSPAGTGSRTTPRAVERRPS